MLKLNLGDGGVPIDGFVGIDRQRGEEVYPLAFDDNTADEIRASHILEHFSHRLVANVLRDWVRVLKPGGVLKLAVPDFRIIAEQYVKGEPINVQGYVMGGQVDENDHHGCIFDENGLREVMAQAGLEDITRWQDTVGDCASLAVSLNLQGVKRSAFASGEERAFEASLKARAQQTQAIMSMPRLAFTDNYFCAMRAFPPLGIELRKVTGAFWGQCLERGIEEAISEGARYIITVDYDSIYTQDDVNALLALSLKYPEADAIAPIQAARTKSSAMFTKKGADGVNLGTLAREFFEGELSQVSTAHFGLTLLKVEALEKLPKPWFFGEPNPETGRWDDGRTDDDIHLWRLFERAGLNLSLANRVAIGHAELMIRWPDVNLEAMHQHPADYWRAGKPPESWQ